MTQLKVKMTELRDIHKVTAVVYFRIVHPEKAILQVVDPWEATSQLAQTTLRSVAGQHVVDEMLAQRDKLNAAIQQGSGASRDFGRKNGR
jgi:regulator of protease activity HflC (stomatin/prohibitin superfamily)